MKLTMKEIAFLAEQFPERTTLSLFSTVKQTPDGTEEVSLGQKGIFKDGLLSQEAKAILSVVASAEQASRLIVQDSLTLLEKYTYRVGDTIALVENLGDTLEISLPEDFSTIGYEVSQFIGMSNQKTTGIEVLLPVDEAMTLLAVIDHYRNYALKEYLGEAVEEEITIDGIKKFLASKETNSLVQMLKVNYGYQEPIESAVLPALEKLAEKGCVSGKDRYQLTPEYALLAKRFLIPETMVLIEGFSINEEGVLVVAGGMGLSAGIKDQIFCIIDNEEMELKAVAGLEMLQTIEGFLACPVF
jgi:hypothetical protein